MPLRFVWDNYYYNYFVPVTNCVSILRSYLQYIYKMRINIGQKVKIERVINNQCKKKRNKEKGGGRNASHATCYYLLFFSSNN